MPATRLRRSLYRTETVIGLALGVVSGLRGVGYLPPYAPAESPPTLTPFTNLLPLWVYGLLWIPLLPMSVAAIWLRPLWISTVAAFSGLCAFSGFLAIVAWLGDGAGRGWMSAIIYILLAVVIGGLVHMAAVADRLLALIQTIIRGQV